MLFIIKIYLNYINSLYMKHITPLLVIDNQITHQEETDFWSPKWKVCPSVCPVKFVLYLCLLLWFSTL